MSNKALQLMGLKVDELLKNALLKQNAGRIKRDEHRMFWQQTTEKQQNALIYINDMCAKLQAALVDNKPTSVRVDVLVTTIQFITLFVDFKAGHGSIKTFVESFSKTPAAMNNPTVKDVLRSLEYSKEKFTGAGSLCRHLITQCTILHTSDGFTKLDDPIGCPTFIDADVSSVESALGYIFLRSKCLGDKETLVGILGHLGPLLRTIPMQMKANPRLGESTLMASLHMIRHLLATAPVNSPAVMTQNINFVKDYYMWPLPFGQLAKETLESLAAEAAMPGAGLRELLAREYRVAALGGFDDAFGQSQRPVYYFVHSRTQEAVMFSQMMELAKWKGLKKEAVSQGQPPAAVKCALLMNLLALHIDMKDDEASFYELNPEQAIELYDKALKIITEVPQKHEDEKEAQEVRTQELERIKTVLTRIVTSPSGEKIKMPFPLPPNYVPPVPAIKHISIDTNSNIYVIPKPSDLESKGIYDYTEYPETPALEFLREIFQLHRPHAASNPVVRLVIAGGNEQLHNVSCAYFHIKQNNPELLEGLEPKFFVVPFGRNHLASFLARYDSWYNRHIYGPFRSPLLMVPGIQIDDKNQRDENMITPPGRLLRDLTESYYRESLREFHVAAWVVEGWVPATPETGGGESKRDRNGMSHVAIPCMMRVEMGRVPDARQFQLARAKQIGDDNKTQYQSMTLDNVLKDKTFLASFNPPDVTVEIQCVDVNGDPIADSGGRKQNSRVVDKNASYETIVMANIPTMGDKAFAPDPSSKWLELFTQLSEKARKNARLVSNVLMKEPQQHVGFVEITCENPSQSIVARVDGQNFGPFVKIRVSPMKLHNKKTEQQQTLPIQTLFPVSM